MSTATHSDARTMQIVAKADAAGFELNNRAQWFLHNVLLAPGAVHLDDDAAALFSRSLEYLEPGVLTVDRPDLPLAMGDMLPENVLPEGSTSYRYYLQDMQGEWRYDAGGAGDEQLTSSISGAEITGRLQIATGGYSYSEEDLRNWSFAQRGSLPQMLSSGSLRGRAQLQDETLAWGRESLKLYGLLKFPGSTIITAADNGAGSTDWFDKTVDQIVTDIGALKDAISDATNLVRFPTRILMSYRTMEFLKRKRITDAGVSGTGVTYWEYIMKVFVTGGSVPNGPELPRPENPLEFRWVRYLDGTNSRSEVDGVPQLPVVNGNRTDSVFAYIHNNDRVVSKDVTSMTGGRFLAPQRRMLKTIIPGEAKWGGVRSPEPATMARLDGVFGNRAA